MAEERPNIGGEQDEVMRRESYAAMPDALQHDVWGTRVQRRPDRPPGRRPGTRSDERVNYGSFQLGATPLRERPAGP